MNRSVYNYWDAVLRLTTSGLFSRGGFNRYVMWFIIVAIAHCLQLRPLDKIK